MLNAVYPNQKNDNFQIYWPTEKILALFEQKKKISHEAYDIRGDIHIFIVYTI